MNTYFYWPYDEVTAELSADQKELIIKAPWLQASQPVSLANLPAANELVEKFKNNSLSTQDMTLIHGAFQAIQKYPFCYILPGQKGGDLESPDLLDRDLIALAPKELLLATIKKSNPHEVTLAEDDVLLLFNQLSRHEWEWDAEAALQFAAIDSLIHPESLFSVVRRFHLLEVMENDKGSEIFQKIENLPSDSFKRLALVRTS